MALRTALAVAVPVMVLAALMHPSFQATATLAVLPSPEFTVRNAAGSHDPNTSTLALDQIMKAETAILDSDDLHDSALREIGRARVYPRIFGDPPGPLARAAGAILHGLLSLWRVRPQDPDAARQERGLRAFRADLTVVPAKDANIITISFSNENGGIAASVVNALLKFYAARRAHLYEDPQIDVLRRTVAITAAATEAADMRLDQFKRSHDISDFGQQRSLLLQRAARDGQDSADAESARLQAQARLETLSHVLRGEPASVPLYHEQDPDLRLQAVNGALQDMRSKLAAAREKYLDQSRVVTAMSASLHAAEAEAARLSHDPVTSITRQGRNPNLETLRLERAQANAELAAATARRDAAAGDEAAARSSLAAFDQAELQLTELERRRGTAEANYKTASRILADRHLSEAEDSLRLANVRVIQPALTPQKQRPIPYLVIAAGVLFGVLAAIGRLVTRFVVRPVFLTAEGLALTTGLPVLADFTVADDVSLDELEFV